MLLFFRSYEQYRIRVEEYTFSGRFRNYAKKYRLLYQNSTVAFAISLSQIAVILIIRTEAYLGLLNMILVTDVIIGILIAVAFFRRPGIGKTLSGSEKADHDRSSYLHGLANERGERIPELRIIKNSSERNPNAFSWTLPRGRGYIFANESLFSVLTREEVGAIFVHELGHIKGRHSEKSFLLTSFIPLLWLNFITLPFAFLPTLFAVSASIFSVLMAVLYIVFRRGYISRRFEKIADKFAANNYDRDVYISSLRKLTLVGSFDTTRKRRALKSHDSLEERERLIRSLGSQEQ